VDLLCLQSSLTVSRIYVGDDGEALELSLSRVVLRGWPVGDFQAMICRLFLRRGTEGIG